jgi:photosystem II stability/assembly factor-like uncharacterized protein
LHSIDANLEHGVMTDLCVDRSVLTVLSLPSAIIRAMLRIFYATAIAAVLTVHAPSQSPSLQQVVDGLALRNIGPFRTGSWVTAIAVPEAPKHDHLYTIWVGQRSGGVWKTTNGGVSWDPVFDSAGVAAIGDIAIAPSDSRIVWVGTGDQANARSSYSGRGLFKTTDGGATWQAMGLPDSHHIARILIDPADPNRVYVAAMGHLFSRNEERGVFRTTDGGETWSNVLYLDDRIGAIDLVIDRRSPSVLYAAMYDKERMPWRLIESGPGTGIYKSVDGGDSWKKLGGGLPAGQLGRIGLDIFQKNPNILYALIENQNAPTKPVANGRGATAQASRGGSQSIVGNELYRTDDSGTTWRRTSTINVAGGKAPYSFNHLRIDPANDQRVIVTSDSMTVTEDGGKTWDDQKVWPNGFVRRAFGDFRTMWFDPDDPLRILLGSDGGLQFSFDGGHTSDYFPNIRAGEAYSIGVDMDDPYHVYAGFQDHDSWKGPVNGRWGVITLEDWVTVGPGDGMYNVVDPTDSRWVYNTREMNQLGRMDQRTGIRTDIRPPPPTNADAATRLRYNWIAPIALSPHDPSTLYAAAQVLFRSKDRGDHWETISPDLTTNDADKIGYTTTPFCTISSISESPITAGVIWVGTDDGKVQLTRDAGGQWSDLTPALVAAGAPIDRWVSRVFASPYDAATAFVAKNGFRNDDFTPYLYKTTDFGRTWRSLSANLPSAPINVVVQDRKNPALLFVGNDLGAFASIDDGAHWVRFTGGFPTVAVHDLMVHPREQDLVLATYGRALWNGDIAPLQELRSSTLDEDAYLFDIKPKARYGFGTQGMNYELYGNKYLRVPNEPEAWAVNYYLKANQPSAARISVTDANGAVVRQLEGPSKAGLNRVLVPLGGGGRGQASSGGGRAGAAPTVPLSIGTYRVSIAVAGRTLTKPAVVRDRIGG